MATVHLIFGPLGAGKSTLASRITEETQAVCFSIDAWMQQLYAADRPDPLSLAWVVPRVQRCEALIWKTCVPVLRGGIDVVLDLGFMTFENRQRFRVLADETGHRVANHFVDADRSLRKERVMQRNDAKGETYAFEVSAAMFDVMDALFERPSAIELKECACV
ncbi:AAA family ATPase [Burkholderia ubonensis]|uniref:Kinase n=1 Tax=Burkholderia ubonensis subsp. mesacidophila TaxID=265293 RepID=A0A2A4FC74_9BURK|nr:ATP-binding protein [Burkholderia ubonensis]PCE30607.1 kinase [Burkholderia ubonensis subsp. mesacidophila]